MICFQDKPFNIKIIQDYATTTNAMEPEVKGTYEDLWELLELTPKSNLLLIMGNWNANVRSQVLAGVTSKFGLGEQNRAGQSLTVIPKEDTGHRKHPLSTTKEMTLHTDIIRWTVPKSNWLHSLQLKIVNLYTISKNNTVNGLWHRWWAPYFKFRLKLKKVGKTTRPFRFDLNKIPYDYSVEITHRFKELDLIECPKNYGQGF